MSIHGNNEMIHGTRRKVYMGLDGIEWDEMIQNETKRMKAREPVSIFVIEKSVVAMYLLHI